MKKRGRFKGLNFESFKKYFGISVFLFGCFVVMSYSYGMTGAVVSDSSFENISPIFGLIFIIGGIILFVEEREDKEGGLEQLTGAELPIIKTKHFERATKSHYDPRIAKAIGKIGTGLGKPEILRGALRDYWSIRSSRGGRIIYEKNRGGIYLIDYLPSHEYDTFQKNHSYHPPQ